MDLTLYFICWLEYLRSDEWGGRRKKEYEGAKDGFWDSDDEQSEPPKSEDV